MSPLPKNEQTRVRNQPPPKPRRPGWGRRRTLRHPSTPPPPLPMPPTPPQTQMPPSTSLTPPRLAQTKPQTPLTQHRPPGSTKNSLSKCCNNHHHHHSLAAPASPLLSRGLNYLSSVLNDFLSWQYLLHYLAAFVALLYMCGSCCICYETTPSPQIKTLIHTSDI